MGNDYKLENSFLAQACVRFNEGHVRFTTPLLKFKDKNKDPNNIGLSGSTRTCMWQYSQSQEA